MTTEPPSMTVSWFVPAFRRDYDRVPASVWIRCLQLHAYLEREGIRSVVNDASARADVAVFVRMQDATARSLARAARARGTRVVLDLCVNYYDVSPIAEGVGVTRHHVDECLAMTALADVVTAASANIAARASEVHPRAVYLPDSVDVAHFRHVKHWDPRPDVPPRAIWAGVAAKAGDLEPVLPILQARGMPLVVIADEKPKLSGSFEFVRWRHREVPLDLLRGDVCIAPRVVDNTYNLGHSFFKVGLFLAVGVPAIASPVPSYREVLFSGRTGLFAESTADWERALDAVAAEPSVLERWGKEARVVMEPYHTANVARRWAGVLREAIACAR